MAESPLNFSEGSGASSYRSRSQSLQEHSKTVNLLHRHPSFYKKFVCFTRQRWHLALPSFCETDSLSLELVVSASFTDPAMTLQLIKYLSIFCCCCSFPKTGPSLQFYRSYRGVFFYILLPSAAILLHARRVAPSHAVSLQLVVSHLALTSLFVLGR